MFQYFRRLTPLLVATCLVATSSVGGTAQNAEEVRTRAEAGDALAQSTLGSMYTSGEGVAQDDTEALRWYRLAADQGLAAAQAGLGYMYLNGRVSGWIPNYTEALRWYRLAADQGSAFAQVGMGFMYADGRGVPQDDLVAYVWSSLAVAQGYLDAQSIRDLVSERLTADQRAEAQRLVRDWRPRNTPSPVGSVQEKFNAEVFRFIGMKTTSNGYTNYHSLDFDIGLQRRQDGETGSYEKWTMIFNSELNSYSLNIVRLDSELRSWEYSTTDGSIVWDNADWENGNLELRLGRGDGEQVRIRVDLAYNEPGYPVQSGIYLRGFQASGRCCFDRAFSTTEYVTVEETFTVPVEIPGFNKR